MVNLEKRPLNGQEMADFLKKKLNNLFEEYEIDFAYLGGSWSRAQNIWKSDIDVFISVPNIRELKTKVQLGKLTEINVKIVDITNFQEIELSIIETLPLHIQFNVIHDGILLYERFSGARASFLEKMLPLYYDHMIWYNRLLKQSKYLSSSE